MKTYRIFDCTTVVQTGDRFVFGFEFIANAYCTLLTMITGRPHDYNPVSQETTEWLHL